MAFSKTQDKLLALTQLRDWSTTSMGHPSTWPLSLRTLVQHMLNSRFPMFLAWGPELSCVYNEAYQVFLADKHPAAMGEPFQQVWAEIWDDIFPFVSEALAGGSPQWEDLPLVIRRNGADERAWFTFSHSPVFDDENRINGMLCTVAETTSRVLAESRAAFQLKLADTLRERGHPRDVVAAASRVIGEHFQVARVGYADVNEVSGTVTVLRDWSRETGRSLTEESLLLEDIAPGKVKELQAGRIVCVDGSAIDCHQEQGTLAYTAIGAKSVLVVPLLHAGELTAVLFLFESQPRAWATEDITLVEDVARRTWEAVKRSQVEEQLRDESRVLEMLYETGKVVSSTLDLRTLLQTIIDRATALSGAKFGAFFYSTKTDNGEVVMLHTLSGAPREAFEKLGPVRPTAVLSPLFRNEAPIRSDDITKDPRYGRAGPHHGMPAGHLPVRSYLAVPVVLRSGEPIGAFLFGHPEPGVFTDRSERMVLAIASQAAIALDNARLYEDAQSSAKERQVLLARERAARAEAEKLSKAKDEFLAMLAHELRNPLAPISSAAEMLARFQLDASQIQATSRIIVRQVKHMTGLIDDLLDVSRVTQGLAALALAPVDIGQVVADAVEQIRPAIDRRHHQLNLQLLAARTYVQGDHKRLVQVVGNILSNSAKYTPEGGNIEVSLEEEGRDVVLRVTDNGIGIAAELLPHVFDLFTQAERTPDRSQGGLGLGLALVKSLVQLQGGTVAIRSEGLGQGSSVEVRLPRLSNVKPSDNCSVTDTSAQSSRSLRVLVVDDNTDAAGTLTLFLESAGHTVTALHSSEGALLHARTYQYDACLLDIGLPDMDGIELARRLRGLPNTQKAVFVAVTGYGRQADRDNAMAAGFDHYIVKPARATELLSILAETSPPPGS